MDQESLKAEFLALYDANHQALYRFCVLKVSSAERAQDFTQEVFTRYWQALRTGTVIKNDRAFLYTTARNLIIDWYRKKKESSLDALTEEGIEFAGDAAESVTQSAEVAEIMKVLDSLDEDSREVLILRFLEGLSPKDIALIRNETANVISVRINRAVKKVQQRIHEPH